jgi:uncharacterized protein (TIGR02246 family)
MKHLLFALFVMPLFALSGGDQAAMEKVIADYTDSWNRFEGKGFGKDFTEDADFVNIFGMKFAGRQEIEERHVKILQTFYKGSNLEILKTEFREVQPEFVIANVYWRLYGCRPPGPDCTSPGETREGVFMQVFVRDGGKWAITASQNTMAPKK